MAQPVGLVVRPRGAHLARGQASPRRGWPALVQQPRTRAQGDLGVEADPEAAHELLRAEDPVDDDLRLPGPLPQADQLLGQHLARSEVAPTGAANGGGAL